LNGLITAMTIFMGPSPAARVHQSGVPGGLDDTTRATASPRGNREPSIKRRARVAQRV
jgi:hypothetical protein